MEVTSFFASLSPLCVWLIILVAIVDLILKGFALWRSAQRCQKGWFIFLLILNTAGILPLIYLLTHRKHRE
jgi:hypothetical protein